MYKKSITRIENENESSQADLSNPVLHDIIATNHVVLAKKPREERLSRACKALIIMIILALVATGIIVLTLVLAHSRNTLMAMISRSAEESFLSTSNQSRLLMVDQDNFTTVSNEGTENQNRQTTTIVSLTSNNIRRLTSSNVYISSLIMRTKQQYPHISLTTQSPSMKPYPSLNTIVNDKSTISTTIQTTVSDQQTTFRFSSYPPTSMRTENQLITTMSSEEDVQTSSTDKPITTSVFNSPSTFVREETTLFTSYINRHFDIQTSTMPNKTPKQTNKLAKKLPQHLVEDDVMDDLLFS